MKARQVVGLVEGKREMAARRGACQWVDDAATDTTSFPSPAFQALSFHRRPAVSQPLAKRLSDSVSLSGSGVSTPFQREAAVRILLRGEPGSRS
jgi:hypothetical protein